MNKELKAMLFDINISLRKVNERLDKLEGAHAKDPGRDGGERVYPVRVVRPAGKKTANKELKPKSAADRGSDRAEHGEDTDIETVRARRTQEALNLEQGVHAAVASYRPPDAPDTPPTRAKEDLIYWHNGDIIHCQACKEPIFEVKKDIRSTTLLSDLTKHLLPYSDRVSLTGHTPVHFAGGVKFDCQLCKQIMGVVIM